MAAKQEGARMGIAVKGLILKDGNILYLIRSEKEGYRPNSIDLPGGKAELGERPEEALQREVMEETGLVAEIGQLLRTWGFQIHGVEVIGFTFLCRYVSGDVRLSEEHCRYMWKSMKEAEMIEGPDWIREDILALKAHLKAHPSERI